MNHKPIPARLHPIASEQTEDLARPVTFDASQWQLVPKVPTGEMIVAGNNKKNYCIASDVYTAMLAAAPTPAAQSAGQEAVAYIHPDTLAMLRDGKSGHVWASEGMQKQRVPLYAAPVNAAGLTAIRYPDACIPQTDDSSFEFADGPDSEGFKGPRPWNGFAADAPQMGEGIDAPSISPTFEQARDALCDALDAYPPKRSAAPVNGGEREKSLTPHGADVEQMLDADERKPWASEGEHFGGGNQELPSETVAHLKAERAADAPQVGNAPNMRSALQQALMALTGYLPAHRNAVTDAAIASARAALSSPAKVGGDEREAAFSKIMGDPSMPDSDETTYDMWLFDKAWDAATEARAALSAEGGEDKRDAERLDWMCQHSAYMAFSRDGEVCWVVMQDDEERRGATSDVYDTTREAIDAAIAAKLAEE